jgi:methylenetetrahydrofolate dehydrogenase (NADP+)/methenyltetrahydrofolate cyclohydrolase
MAIILNGKELSEQQLSLALRELESLKKTLPLATIRIGDAPDSKIYETYLEKMLGKIGIRLRSIHLGVSVAEKKVISEISRLNRDRRITGVLVFAPLPKHISHANVFENLNPLKDVEGRTFLKSHFGVYSPTANAVMTLLDATGKDLLGLEAVVIGHSDVVGKPTAVLLMDRHATVTVCQKETRDLKSHVKRADILVSAAGKAHLIKGDWIKKGAIVIDVGENMLDGKIVGDVDFEKAKTRASFISPVPGGVGPVTNITLIKNLIRLHKRQHKIT